MPTNIWKALLEYCMLPSMRRCLVALLLLAYLHAPAFAQSNLSGPVLVVGFPGVPSGACSTLQLAVNTTNGNLYTCNGGAWTIVSGGGGGVTNVATTSPISGGPITTTGTISCPTCVTSAASLTNNAVVIGGGGQASSTISADTTTTHALFATAGAPAFRAIASGDLPTLSTTVNTNTCTIGSSCTLSLDQLNALAASKTFANGNNSLTFNAATTTSSQTAVSFGETTAATGTTDVEVGISTLSTSTAIALQISGGAGPSGAAAPNVLSVTGGAGGAAASVTSGGNTGSAIGLTCGNGSAGGATSGTGGTGGTCTITAGNGGNATAGSNNGNGGNVGIVLGTAGTGGNGGGPGNLTIKSGTGSSNTQFQNSAGTTELGIRHDLGTINTYAGFTVTTFGAHISRFISTTPVTVNANSTSPQNLQTFTFGAAELNTATYSIRVTNFGYYTTQTGQTPTITMAVSLGGVNICSWTSGATTQSLTNMPFQLDCYATVTVTGGSGKVRAHGYLSIDQGTSTTSAATVFQDTNTADSSAINIAGSPVILVTATFSTNAATANTITGDTIYVEKF